MSRLRSDLEVRQCRVLVAVSDEGGVVAAAQALGISQSTVSETLLALERLLAVPILQRSPGRGAVLTPAAEALLPHARALISASEAAMAAVFGSAGVVRLGVVESVGSFLLPKPLSEVRKRWPNVDVQVTIGLCEDLRRRARRLELDAAITLEGVRRAAGNRPGAKTLSPVQLHFVVSPETASGMNPVSRDGLRDRSLLLADSAGAFNSLLRAWFGPRGRCPRLESAGSIDGVKRGVLASDAIGVLPAYAVASELADGTLVSLRVREPLPAIALYLTVPKSQAPAPALEAVTQQICSNLAPGAPA